MSIKKVTLQLNGQIHTIPLQSGGIYSKQITAPELSSCNQAGNIYAMVLNVEDDAGNITTIDQTDETYGSALKLRVKEKTAPEIMVISPGKGAYLTDNDVVIKFDVTDNDSGVANVSIKCDNTVRELTKIEIPRGFRYTGTVPLTDGPHTLEITAADNDENTTVETTDWTVDTVPPVLDLSAPAPGLITNQLLCTVIGVTNDATSGLASVAVTLNGEDQGSIAVAADGVFSKGLTLSKGENNIIVTATDKAGKQSEVSRFVQYDPDAPVILSVTLSKNPVETGEIFELTVQATD